jgi:hypothetical protein
MFFFLSCCSRFSGYRACPSTQGLRVQTWSSTIKIHSTTSFEGEVKLSASCLKILQRVKDSCGV